MILVSGAGGKVGQALVRELEAADVAFRAAHRSLEKAEAAQAQDLDAVTIDFARPATLRAALDGVDTLFLLAPPAPNQTELELAAIDAAKSAGVEYIVKLSVWGADSEGFTFARWHRPVELALAESGVDHCILRPNAFMQNMIGNFAYTIRDHGAFYMPDAAVQISHIDTRDIARVAATVLQDRAHAGKTYALSGPEALSYPQIAEIFSGVVGKPVRHVDIATDAFRESAITAGLPAWMADAILDLIAYYAEGDAATVTPAVKKITGTAPNRFEAFAREHREEFIV